MLEPKELVLKDASGKERTFILSKFPAIAGREIITQYPTSAVPKLGDYAVNEALMLKIMAYVAVQMPEGPALPLTTRGLVDNHTGDWETLVRLEWAMMEYNCSFFGQGLNSNFLESISQKAVTWITQTLMPLLEQSLQAEKRASRNSKPS
jgi:hypothetical protein